MRGRGPPEADAAAGWVFECTSAYDLTALEGSGLHFAHSERSSPPRARCYGARMLTIDERIGEDGTSVTTRVQLVDGALRVTVGDHVAGSVPLAALGVVMDRYAKPLADGIAPRGPALDLGDGSVLRVLRHRALYDVIARDFLVLERPGLEPLAELGVTIASALAHLARATARAEAEAG